MASDKWDELSDMLRGRLREKRVDFADERQYRTIKQAINQVFPQLRDDDIDQALSHCERNLSPDEAQDEIIDCVRRAMADKARRLNSPNFDSDKRR